MYKQGFIRLMRIAMGFRESKILLVANDLDLFCHLAKEPRTSSDLAAMLQVDLRALTILMDALVAMAVLRKTDKLYSNTEIADAFLVKGGAEYRGDFLKIVNVYWNQWSRLDDILAKGGNPVDPFAVRAGERSYNQSYIWGMDNMGKERAERIADVLDLSEVRTMLDLGGGAATYSIAFAKKYRQLNSLILDLRFPLEVARENINRNGLGDRIQTREGSYWDADYGTGYDFVWISQIVHGLSDVEGARLVCKAAGALSPGGRLILHDSLLAEDRCSPYHAALFSAYMLALTVQGRCYTVNEVKQWFADAGLSEISRCELDAESEMVIGIKK